MNSILTVLTPSSTFDLTILATVKGELELTNAANDAQLEGFIHRASAAIAGHCNRVFALEGIREEFWPEDQAAVLDSTFSPLRLTRFPVDAVTLATEDGTALVENTDFRVVKNRGQLLRLDANLRPTAWSAQAIVIEYSAGYALLDGLPWKIEDAAIRTVKRLYFGRKRDPSLRQESIPGVRDVTYWVSTGLEEIGNLTPDVLELLNEFRVPVIA